MVLITMVVRTADGLPLAASIENNEDLQKNVAEYETVAKSLVLSLTPTSPTKRSIKLGPYFFHYIVAKHVCCLTLCDQKFQEEVVYAFMDDISQEFYLQFGHVIANASGRNAYNEFERYIQQSKKTYMDCARGPFPAKVNMCLPEDQPFTLVLMTIVGRVHDGLPLAEFAQEDDDQQAKNIVVYRNQAKRLFKTLTHASLDKCSIKTGAYLFHYIIEKDICCLSLCDINFNRQLAFSFLRDLSEEFYSQYRRVITNVTSPYSLNEFDTYIQEATITYGQLHLPLSDFTTTEFTAQDIDDVLQRGAERYASGESKLQ